jgi:hypothetical protein
MKQAKLQGKNKLGDAAFLCNAVTMQRYDTVNIQ